MLKLTFADIEALWTILFTQQIKDGFHRKMSVLAILVDLKAAYGIVWQPMLIHKLAMYNIPGYLFNWIKSFLSQRLVPSVPQPQ